MKKMKFMALAAVCVALFAFSSCSDDDDVKPTDAAHNALMAKYPDATHIEWEKKKTYLVADCYINSKDADVWFTEDGTWKMTEYELLPADLPQAIATAISGSEYASWRIDDRDLLEYPGKASVYVVEVEEHNKEFDLYFSAEGALIEARDVSNADDTHWPE